MSDDDTRAGDLEEAAERARALVREATEWGTEVLDEVSAKSLLAAYGVPVPAGSLVRDEEEARAAAERLGGRLVAKAVGIDRQDRAGRGLDIGGVVGGTAAAQAVRTLKERVGADYQGALLERTSEGDDAYLLGFRRDPVFGPVVVFGAGRALGGASDDLAMAVVPLSDDDAFALSQRATTVDRSHLVRAIQAVARMAQDFPQIAQVEIDPLLMGEDRAVAVDARVTLSPEVQPLRLTRSLVPDLRAVLAPASVAVVGVSEDTATWGGSALHSLLDGGYVGVVYPIDPRGGTCLGLPVYPDLARLPATPDLAVLAVPGAQVVGALEECGRRGVRAAVVLGQATDEERRAIAAAAMAHRLTVLGPHCRGLVSSEARLQVTDPRTAPALAGGLSLISQSGDTGPAVVDICARRGIGINTFVSVGDEAVVSVFDVLEYLADDASTRCVLLCLERLTDGRRFLDAARRVTAQKPVVVLASGLTDRIFRAAARQAGVVLAETPEDLVARGSTLASLPPIF